MLAFTRAVPSSFAECQLTHLTRVPIDMALAAAQHDRYEDELRNLGCTVERLPPTPELPDSVFVEDTAVVLDEIAIITRPGAESRRAETASVANALRNHRKLAFIQAPATLDGGDVLRIGKRIFVGKTPRTDAAGIRQLRVLVEPFGYSVEGVPVHGCLHLKTAVTQVSENTVLINPMWVNTAVFAGFERINVAPEEPHAANALLIGGVALFPSAFPRTARLLEQRGISVRQIDVLEIAKAEGGMTCCSIVLSNPK